MEAKQCLSSSSIPNRSHNNHAKDIALDESKRCLQSKESDDLITQREFKSLSIDQQSHIKKSNPSGEAEDKHSDDRESMDEGDMEFESLRNKPNLADSMVSENPHAKKVALGLRINYMTMRDGHSRQLMWESKRFNEVAVNSEMKEYIPKEILKCSAVSREINFTSAEQINDFIIIQRVFFKGHCIEEWFFKFGFVIPGSTNTWEQIIEAAHPSSMLTAEELSGNVTFETSFCDNKILLCKNLVRIYYE